jgi:hypothetical protein
MQSFNGSDTVVHYNQGFRIPGGEEGRGLKSIFPIKNG